MHFARPSIMAAFLLLTDVKLFLILQFVLSILQMAQPAPAAAVTPPWAWAIRISPYVILSAVFVLLAVTFGLSDEARVSRLLSTPQLVTVLPPQVQFFVERPEIDIIAKCLGGNRSNFLVVEGGNRMGKSTAVAMAVSRLSRTTAVVGADAEVVDTLETLLRRMLYLTGTTLMHRVLALVPAPLQAESMASVLLNRPHTAQQPIFVVESAEKLPETTLNAAFILAKRLVDAQLGRFVFVFAPSDKLETVAGHELRALTRATVINVGDMGEANTRAYLEAKGCPAERASAVFRITGGHLAALVENLAVDAFCSGAIDAAAARGCGGRFGPCR